MPTVRAADGQEIGPGGINDRLGAILEDRRVGLWEWDVLTGHISCSPGLELLHHRAPGTFSGTYEGLMSLLHPADRERFAAAVSQALEQKSDFCFEYRIVPPDNAERWIESRGRVVWDGQGSAVRVIGVCADITERKQTLDSLRHGDESYRSLVEATKEGVWLLDTQGRTLYVNWRLSLMLGHTADELVGRRLASFCLPDDRRTAADKIQSCLLGAAHEFELRFRHKDGRDVLAFASMTPTRVGGGKIIGALGLFWDVTTQKKAEESIRQSQVPFLELAQHLDDVFWVADAVSGKVTYVTPAYERLWGRTTAALLENSLDWVEAIHPR